ncbi:hypothetical protein [Desulfotomaculum sp. 1211_IL3151]|uniref:hypothetical protein n=1 Tax=Desulfotomaculum sp. 1211_IL3151 TaxID=3084055 RepID=UPI002FDB7870
MQHMIFNVIHCLRNERLNICLGENTNLHPLKMTFKLSRARADKQGGVHTDTAEKIRNLTKQSDSVLNESKLTTDDLNFVAYKIVNNPKSNSYYQYDYAHFIENDLIFVVLETKTGFIHSNSGKLMLELRIEQGVSQYDYDNQTLLFIDYLASLDLYSNDEY